MAATNQAQTSDSYSHTNLQVEGVDEGDIVKTDGTYIYTVSGNTVHIVKAEPANQLTEVSSLTDTSDPFNPSDLYIVGDRLVVMGNTYGSGYYGGPIRIMGNGGGTSVSPIYPGYRPHKRKHASTMSPIVLIPLSNARCPSKAPPSRHA